MHLLSQRLLQTGSYNVSIHPRRLSILSSHVSPAFPTWHTDDGCGLLPHIRPPVRLSTVGRRAFPVPPSGTTCLSTSRLRRHSRFSDNDSRPFCFRSYQDTIM